MKEVKFEEWVLWVDYDITKETYNNIVREACKCAECRNFRSAGLLAFPEIILQLFLELGIDPLKHAELSHMGIEGENPIRTGGWFHFKGRFEGKRFLSETGTDFQSYMGSINENFRIGFSYLNHLSIFDKSHSDQLVQLDFDTTIPWLLESDGNTE